MRAAGFSVRRTVRLAASAIRLSLSAAAFGLLLVCSVEPARADPAFKAFLETVWPEAKVAGVSRATFDRAFQGVEPDLTLPDLVLAGRPQDGSKGQAEFTRPPQDYVARDQLIRLADQGRVLRTKHTQTLAEVERQIGVDGPVVLGIWGRETAYGAHRATHYAVRVLATQAYTGRRQEMFRAELIAALRLLEDRILTVATMRSSWAGAMGLTQFMPTEYFKNGTDFDGNGRIDLAHSVPDALASAARQLKEKGWVLGQPWGYEVVVPASASCALEGPPGIRKLSEWTAMGFKRTGGKLFRPADFDHEAYLMMPAGTHGPAFLALENFQVIRRYNTSDLYALFVGNLADRIAGGGNFDTAWGTVPQPATKLVADLQARLKALGYPMDKIDGKIGSNTRRQIGIFETAAGRRPGCWPTPEVLAAAMKTAVQ